MAFRILIAKPGLDGHDRGAKVMAYALKEQGYEVIYTGLRQTPESIVRAAVLEDVRLIGLSVLSGAHLHLCAEVMRMLREKGADIPVVVGGIIPEDDVEKLLQLGIRKVFGPGTFTRDVLETIDDIKEAH